MNYADLICRGDFAENITQYLNLAERIKYSFLFNIDVVDQFKKELSKRIYQLTSMPPSEERSYYPKGNNQPDFKLEELYTLLQESDGYISGSIIVQCLIDETYDSSDIDIFVKYGGHEQLHQYLVDHASTYVNSTEYVNKPGLDVKNYFIGGAKFQVTAVTFSDLPWSKGRVTSIPDYIRYGFDFDVLMNWFNGKVFHVRNIEAIRTKTITILRDEDVKFTERMQRYANRNYVFTNIKLSDEKVVHLRKWAVYEPKLYSIYEVLNHPFSKCLELFDITPEGTSSTYAANSAYIRLPNHGKKNFMKFVQREIEHQKSYHNFIFNEKLNMFNLYDLDSGYYQPKCETCPYCYLTQLNAKPHYHWKHELILFLDEDNTI